MAFQQPTTVPRQINTSRNDTRQLPAQLEVQQNVEESQEWLLFSPSQAASSLNRTRTTQTEGLSRVSDFGSFDTPARSGRLESTVLDEDATEDADLDSLDEGLQAFGEPPLYQTNSNHIQGTVLPTHDGFGTFPASSPPVLEQLWQHEQYNPKRKHEGHHRRKSSLQRDLSTIDELDAQANEDKRIRIERWRLEQSQALIEEVERETRHRMRRQSIHQGKTSLDLLGSTPTQNDFLSKSRDPPEESEPFWRRITRKFIRDVIGIDEPLLSVILGESLPEEAYDDSLVPKPSSIIQEPPIELNEDVQDDTWRDRLLQRIARELGVFVHQLSPHPGAFTTYNSLSKSPDYAGMPVSIPPSESQAGVEFSKLSGPLNQTSMFSTPNFPPTIRDLAHAESWGFEEESMSSKAVHKDSNLDLQREREYWERELDVKMVFRYLRNRFTKTRASSTEVDQPRHEDAARRVAIIRQHHPLVARAHRSPMRLRRESRLATKRPQSSCASESAKSGRKASITKSGSSGRNYWDIGGSMGSGSIMASGGLMGTWGEV